MTTIFESMPAAVARKCSAAPGVRCGWFQMIEGGSLSPPDDY